MTATTNEKPKEDSVQLDPASLSALLEMDQAIEEGRQPDFSGRKRHGKNYSAGELAAFAKTADQTIRSGSTFVGSAKRLGIAVPTLRKAYRQAGLAVPSRGRRPKLARQVKPEEANPNLVLHPVLARQGPKDPEMLTVCIPLRTIVADNRQRVLDYLLEAKPEGIKSAVRSLLGN